MDYYKDHVNYLNDKLLSELCVFTRNSKQRLSTKKPAAERKRSNTDFMFHDLAVCKEFWLFVHTIGVHRYRNIHSYLKHGIVPKTHGLTGKTPTRSNVLQPADIKRIVTYIQRYAEQNSVVLSGRAPAFKNARLYFTKQ